MQVLTSKSVAWHIFSRTSLPTPNRQSPLATYAQPPFNQDSTVGGSPTDSSLFAWVWFYSITKTSLSSLILDPTYHGNAPEAMESFPGIFGTSKLPSLHNGFITSSEDRIF